MNARLRSVLIIAVVVILDRITKLYIQASFGPFDLVPVIPGFFNIVHVENPGIAFGMLADAPPEWRKLAVAAPSAIVMVIIGVMLWRHRPAEPGKPAQDSILTPIALAMVLGGALGNMWDRLLRGTVTDFLQFFFGPYEFWSFNVADSAITVGASLLIIDLWRHRHAGRSEKKV